MNMNSIRRPAIAVVMLLSMTFASCDIFFSRETEPEPTPTPPAEVDGWAPVYNKDSSAKAIKAVEPRLIENGGKIYIKGDTLYQLESGKGIHVIYVAQPGNPQKVKFINVLGAQEMAIKDNVLYTNNMNDLVVLDIANINNVQVVDRISSVFHLVNGNEPSGTGYYECVDASKGEVVGWEAKTLKYPKCRKN